MFVVSWNSQQDSFSVEPLGDHIINNLIIFREKRPAMFIILGMFETQEEASQFCEVLKDIRDEKPDKHLN